MKHKEINNFSRLYETERKKVDLKLQKLLHGRTPESLYKPASYILESPGKRLRPILVLLSAKACGGKLSQVYNAALAVEMLHNFTLVHDDIMDNADLRRGRTTLHKKYNLNTAILAGDSLLSVAYEYLLKDCKKNAKEALASFTNGLVEVCEGQSLDTDFEMRQSVTIDEYITMIRQKTAMMLKMCCEIGALLVNANPSDTKRLSDYGLNLGIAFQIQDDLLDIVGTEEKFGKRVGGDLIEGKKTFLFLKALEKSKGENRKALLKVIKNKGIKASEVSRYKKIYEDLGVIEEAKKEIRSYTNKALKSVNKISNKNSINIFHWLADSLIKRDQ